MFNQNVARALFNDMGKMIMKKINFKMEYLIYAFFVLSPFLDAFSFLFRKDYPNAMISPSTIIRPVIPCILFIYLYLKEKPCRKKMVLGVFFYGLYAILHLYAFTKLHRESSYGSIFHEMQYLLNYSYMMVMLVLISYFRKQDRLGEIKKYLFFYLMGYIMIIFASILTGSSSSTYIDGIGFKGWFASGNALGSILLLSLLLLFPYIFDKKGSKLRWLLALFTGIYLLFLLGTRTGLLGFPLVVIIYLFYFTIKKLQNKKWQFKVKSMVLMVVLLFIMIGSVFFLGTTTLKRLSHMKEEANQVIDPWTGEVSHVTGDSLVFIETIKKGEMREEVMSKEVQRSMLDMYEIANRYHIPNSSRRALQFIYHTSLIKNQHHLFYLLVGNGHLTNYSEMTFEMELLAILYNFGILGFLLYAWYYVKEFTLGVIMFFKKFKQINVEYYLSLATLGLGLFFSLFAGYTFFNVSSMLMIILATVLLKEERSKLK